MFDAPSTLTRVPVRRWSWLLVSAAAAIGLTIAVTADDSRSSPEIERAAADEGSTDRPLVDRSDTPGASHDDDTLELLQRLVDGGQIPRATLE